jgi:hypothetical protein
MRLNHRLGILMILAITFSLTSCNDSESDDIAKAQACLDKVPQSNPAAADECMQYVSKYDSQQANILKCSIKMTSGGLVEDKVVVAYNALKTSSLDNPSATFISALALNVPDAATGLTKAKEGDVFCQKTGIRSVMTISSLIVSGSVINSLGPTAGGFTDMPPSDAEIDAVLAHCNTSPTPADCDATTVGEAAQTLADSYCTSAKPDQKTCDQIEGAIADAGGDPAKIGAALFCYLDDQTFDPTANGGLGGCVP